MNISIRNSIKNNFKDSTIDDITSSINDGINDKDELGVLDFVVFFEVLFCELFFVFTSSVLLAFFVDVFFWELPDFLDAERLEDFFFLFSAIQPTFLYNIQILSNPFCLSLDIILLWHYNFIKVI